MLTSLVARLAPLRASDVPLPQTPSLLRTPAVALLASATRPSLATLPASAARPRPLALLALVASAALPACGEPSADAPPAHPNVLLVSLDTLRADHLDAYGYERETAPHLARLAADGALFERCLAVANWTLPTHATLFTGLHPAVHGVEEHDDRLSRDVPTLAEAFAAAGYDTAGWYSNPFVGERFGFVRGFGSYAMAKPPGGAAARVEHAGTPRGAITRSAHPEPGARAEDYFVERTAAAVSSEAVDFLDARDGSRPFFLFLHYNDIHSDYIPPAPHDRRFDPDYDGTLTGERYPHNPRVHRDMPAEDLEHVRALYDGEIAWVDEQFGRVLAHLDALGLADDTLVVVTADHGEGFFEHGFKEHHYGLFEELVHVPWILRWPARVPPAQRVAELTGQRDIPVTILDLADVPGLPDAGGRSWADALTGDGPPPPQRPHIARAILDPILEREGDVLHALRTDALTVIERRSPDGRLRTTVYDRRTDPDELDPLPADHPGAARILELLRQAREALAARRRAVGEAETVEEADPELLEQMRQWGYIK